MVSAFFATRTTPVKPVLSMSASYARMVPDLRIRYASLAWTPLSTAAGALTLMSVMLVTAILLSAMSTDFVLNAFLDGHQQLIRPSRIASAMILLTSLEEINVKNAMI
jgi:hypothetical protein